MLLSAATLAGKVSSVLITLKPGGDYMIDQLSKNEARDKTPPNGGEGGGDVVGSSPLHLPPFTASLPVQNKAAKKCFIHVSLGRSFFFGANLSGDFDSFFFFAAYSD